MSKLAVAIIHYHLHPGGVTRVIERAIESLGDNVDIAVLTGENFQALDYSNNRDIPNIGTLFDELRATAQQQLGRNPDIWHIHNHALGKNSFTPQLVWHLANAGCRLLLQPHDFAEDGRPENYRLLRDLPLYPVADHVWYAPINYRDKAFLESIGLPHVHELPNAVTPHSSPEPSVAKKQKTILYPARAIRRKNIGEFLLWSLLAPDGTIFQSTLAPQNPAWQAIYNEWVDFAAELNLPVEFDAGRKHPFSELVQNAEALISTSIAEGFGLAFLEPWIEGKMLIGRKLPEITTDFEQEGLNLSTLYSTLPVPLKWAGETAFFQTLETAMQSSYATYSKPWKPEYFEQAKASLVTAGKVDFGILDESLQRNVIRHLVENPQDRAELPEFMPDASGLIEPNRQVVINRYSLEAYGVRLLGIYQQLATTEPSEVSPGDARALLDQFLKPQRFNLLRA